MCRCIANDVLQWHRIPIFGLGWCPPRLCCRGVQTTVYAAVNLSFSPSKHKDRRLASRYYFLTGLHSDLSPLPPSGDRYGPAVSGVMVEVHVGPLHVADFQQPLQRSLCPHRHRSRHCAVWTLRLLCHLQGAPLDVKTGPSLFWCCSDYYQWWRNIQILYYIL